ncbi:beta-lactamase regulator AmpE [Lacimicrobium sp. SS2-24]|uniref:beta-lactamase regulator AmpE n=1 Tax=Lacimicrobium sp. SS2-24 TaxID=2005569 RepID=UPI000B4A76F5|nr:beta-lactamase regulator AmpE [Lacimicrobium sp. SS2-24]
MTLISLLLVLALERATSKTTYWRSDFYFDRYLAWLQRRDILAAGVSLQTLLAVVLVPAILIWLVLYQLDAMFMTFLVNTAVLMVCVGCPRLRESYRGYLQAASRGDTEAAVLYAEQLGYPCESQNSFGQCLVWINYRHYAAVAIWFVLLGAAGALLYVLTVSMGHYLHQQKHPLSDSWQKVVTLIDWIPARVHTLGLLVVGHFSRALTVWLDYLGSTEVTARKLVTEVAKAAEYVEPEGIECTQEPCTMVRLVKRNMMALLVLVALLTLSGVIN